MGKHNLEDILSEDALKSVAGGRSFEAGKSYFHGERVADIEEVDDVIISRVVGTHTYAARLWAIEEHLGYVCSCPNAQEGNFCKHLVATGLAWLANWHTQSPGRASTFLSIRNYLNGLDKTDVAQLFMDAIAESDGLFNRLALSAAQSATDGPNLGAIRRAIDSAGTLDEYLEWDEIGDYANNLLDVVAALNTLAKSGHPAVAVDMCEYAIATIEQNMEYVDDSSGNIGGLISQLEALHRDACASASLDSEALAYRLYALEMSCEFAFHGALGEYADILGEVGIDAYRREAATAFASLPELVPGNKGSFESQRSTLSSIMVSLAKRSGDVDALVGVKSKDLSASHCFASIAQDLREAGRDIEALQWAERGLAAFPNERKSRLVDLLVTLYNDAGRHEDAIQVAWNLFEQEPSLAGIQYLEAQTKHNGTWGKWRARAMDALFSRVEREDRQRDRWARGRTELIRALLWDGDGDAVWQVMLEGGSIPA